MVSDVQAVTALLEDWDPPDAPRLGDAAGHPTSLAAGTLTTFAGILAQGLPRWTAGSALGTPVNVTYAFRTSVPSDYPSSTDGNIVGTFAPFSTAAQAEARQLLDYVGSVTGLHFTEVTSGNNATIEIGSFTFTSGSTGYAYYPVGTPTSPQGQSGDLWLARSQTGTVGPGSYFDQLFLHELGHTLGLKHPFVGTVDEQLTSTLDRPQFTVMTYQNTGDLTQNLTPTWINGDVSLVWLYRSTYGAFDLQALTYLYGSGTTAHTGDDTYQFGSAPVMKTLSDSGGRDTIDTSNLDLPSIIDLTPGASSSIGIRTQADWLNTLAAQGMPASSRANMIAFLARHATELFTGADDVTIAAGTTIENAIGGRGDDVLRGNAANNHLSGGAGNDTLDGGDGVDTAMFSLAWSNYTITTDGTAYTIAAKSGADGTDALHTIERVRFADGALLLDGGVNGAAAFRLYQAAFARSPDEAGLKVQIHALDTGTTLLQLSLNFLNSAEFQTAYGTPDNGAYATALYKNVLGRNPDLDGLNVQVNALNVGLSREQLLLNFSESAENLSLTAPKTVVGLFVTFIDAAYG
ncbi:MAG: protease [Rhodospirillales bacterium]|nr:protease [Rhodospirillales bacterium]